MNKTGCLVFLLIAILLGVFFLIRNSMDNSETVTMRDVPIMTDALEKSDDFEKFAQEFSNFTAILLDKDVCSLSQIKESGGFTKSTNSPGNVYFTFCPKQLEPNRQIYIDLDKNKHWERSR